MRARIVLLSSKRWGARDVARQACVSLPAVWRWQRRFAEEGVECFSSTLMLSRLQRGTFPGVIDLQAAIKRYIGEHIRSARPVVWTEPAVTIFDALNRPP